MIFPLTISFYSNIITKRLELISTISVGEAVFGIPFSLTIYRLFRANFLSLVLLLLVPLSKLNSVSKALLPTMHSILLVVVMVVFSLLTRTFLVSNELCSFQSRHPRMGIFYFVLLTLGILLTRTTGVYGLLTIFTFLSPQLSHQFVGVQINRFLYSREIATNSWLRNRTRFGQFTKCSALTITFYSLGSTKPRWVSL